MYWLKCQEGLFYQVMRLLRDHKLGGRLHIVVCYPRHRHVVGVPVRTRAAVLQRTAHTRPDLGRELAALPASAKAAGGCRRHC
jgi:hypothetical protein